MGTTSSSPSPLAPAFARMSSWDLKAARRLLQDYKDKDLDFGLDAQGLSELICSDKQWAEAIIDAFGSTNGIVNALAFICGTCLVSTGPAQEKSSLVFDAMDFDGTEQISMDEMTIAFLCCCRGLCIMSGVGVVPSDEALETITLQAYRDFSKSSAQSISKAEFVDWVVKFASGSYSREVADVKEVSLQTAMEQFGVVAAQSQHYLDEEGGSRRAGENNHHVDEGEAAAVADASSAKDDPADGVAADPFDPDEQQDETAAYYETSARHEQDEAADGHGGFAAQVDPAEQPDETQVKHEPAADSAEQHSAAEPHDAETSEPADLDDTATTVHGEDELYAREQQQVESGSSDQGQVPDASRDDEYDDEYAGDSSEPHDVPVESHDQDPPSGYAHAQVDGDFPASSSLEDVKSADIDAVGDSEPPQSTPSRPPSAIPADTDTKGSEEVLDQGTEDIASADSTPMVGEGGASGTDAIESHSIDDTYEEEFAHEELAEGEMHAAEDGDLNEYSMDEHQDPPTEGGEHSQPGQVDVIGQQGEAGAEVKDGGKFEELEVVNNGSAGGEQTPREGEVDVNAFDTYDYEDAAYDASSGLPPPEPADEDEGESAAPAEPDEPAS